MKSEDLTPDRLPPTMNLSGNQLAISVTETAAVVRASWAERPRAAIILGSGLGSLAEHITIEAEWSYRDLPHFARSTAVGHRGRLLAGRLAGVPILAMDGRFHAYEGYSFQQITFPIRVFAELGASFMIVFNASGGLNPTLRSGDILLIDDHINLIAPTFYDDSAESRKPMADRCNTVFQSKSVPALYDARLRTLSKRFAVEEDIQLRCGTYIAVLGPNYETRAEYRWLRTLGDVVGMSTVPEVLAARELGLPVAAFSIVTNVFRPDDIQQTTGEAVINAAAAAEPNLRRIVTRLLASDYGILE